MEPLSFQEMIRQTVVDGKLAVDLEEGLEEIDTVAETIDETNADPEYSEQDALELSIQTMSILSKLDLEHDSSDVNRYETESQRPSNNNDIVLELRDVNLNRVVEARILTDDEDMDSENAQELIHGALILSYLDHPGIPPVYDLDLSSNQQIYCTMKKINGAALSLLTSDKKYDSVLVELPESAETSGASGASQTSGNVNNQHVHQYDTVVEIVNVFIKIADIIAYAHSRQVIHRNLNPGKFIIGQYGEVYVIDWNTALDLEHDDHEAGTLRGTPLYMSPEQANCAEVDKRSDIYSLGASLYHVLFKQPHMMRENFDDFWAQKKLGTIDPVRTGTASSITAPLLAICQRCLEVNPDDRYQDINELVTDLKQYQAGQMVDVYPYGTSDLVAYWMKANATHVKWAAILTSMMLIAAMITYGLYVREQSGWGEAIYTESFDKANEWRNDWTVRNDGSAYEVIDGRLVTKGGPEHVWFYNKRLNGGAAIEFEGEMMPGSAPGDLTVVYSPDIEGLSNGSMPKELYYLQHGGVDNACSTIGGPNGRLDYKLKKLENGEKYIIRGEVDGKHLRLYLNNDLMCSYDLLFPLNSGYIGLYGYYENKAFDNIKIYNRELPQVTNIIKTGDLLFENGLRKLAAERYRKIGELYPDTDIARESQYKLGLCMYEMDMVAEAFEIWDTMAQTEYATQINFYRWNELVRANDYNSLLRQMYETYRSAHPKLQRQIREQWGIFLSQVRQAGDKNLVREFLKFREVNFSNDQIFSEEVLFALRLLGECNKLLTMFPGQDVITGRALFEMGEFQQIIDTYPDSHGMQASALLRMGEYQRVIDEYGDLKSMVRGAMKELGMFKELALMYPNNERREASLMLMKGEYDEIIQKFPGTLWGEAAAVLRKGDARRYLELIGSKSESIGRYDAEASLIFDRYIAGDRTAVNELYEKAMHTNYDQTGNSTIVFQVELLADVLMHLQEEPDALKRTLEKIWTEKKRMMGMRYWYNIGVLLGKISREQYMQQPLQTILDTDYYFYAALHQDLYGSKSVALELYQKHRDVPIHLSRTSLTMRNFVAYRMKELK